MNNVTAYYAAVNELAAMLADDDITLAEWHVQRLLVLHAFHEE